MDKHCLNCENPLQGSDRFCPRCGQKTDIKRLSLRQYLGEWFNSFISLESSFAKSLWFTILRPHQYALEFINGKRKKYTHPYKLFIQTTVFLFLIFTWINSLNNQKQQKFQDKILEASLPGSTFKQAYFKILDTVLDNKIPPDNKTIEKALVYGMKLMYHQISNAEKPVSDSVLLSTRFNLNPADLPLLYQSAQISEKSLQEYIRKTHRNFEMDVHYTDSLVAQIFKQWFPPTLTDALLLKMHYPGASNTYVLKKTGNKDSFINKIQLRLAYQLTKLFINPETPFNFQQFMISKMSLFLLLMLPFYTFLFALFYRSPFNYAELLAFLSIVQVFFLLLTAFTNLLPDLLSIMIWLLAGGIYYYLALKKFFGLKTLAAFWRFFSSSLLYFLIFVIFLTIETLFSVFFV